MYVIKLFIRGMYVIKLFINKRNQELMSAAKPREGASNSNMFCKPSVCQITPLQTALYGKPL